MANRFFYWVREEIKDVAEIADSTLYVALLTAPISDDDLWNARTIADLTSLAEYSAPSYERQLLVAPDMSDADSEDGQMVCLGTHFGVLEPGATGPCRALLLLIAPDFPPDDTTNQPVGVFELSVAVNGDGVKAIDFGWPGGVMIGPSTENDT